MHRRRQQESSRSGVINIRHIRLLVTFIIRNGVCLSAGSRQLSSSWKPDTWITHTTTACRQVTFPLSPARHSPAARIGIPEGESCLLRRLVNVFVGLKLSIELLQSYPRKWRLWFEVCITIVLPLCSRAQGIFAGSTSRIWLEGDKANWQGGKVLPPLHGEITAPTLHSGVLRPHNPQGAQNTAVL